MATWAEYLHLFAVLIAMVNVPGNLPMFLERTQDSSPSERRTVAVTAALATGTVLLVFAFAGEGILGSLGISLAAFKVLGGVVILLIALDMLGFLGERSADQGRTADNPVEVGIVPMAIPVFAGPGAISTVMVYTHKEADPSLTPFSNDLMVAAVIVLVAAIILAGLIAASALSRFLTPLVQHVLSRVLGMVVGALAVEFILEGLAAFFPHLA